MRTLFIILVTSILTFSNEPDSLKPHINGIIEVINQKKCAKTELSDEVIYKIAKNIVKEATKYDRIPHVLLAAIIMGESRFNPYNESKTGAKGLGQFTKSTAKYVCEQLGIPYTDSVVYDPKINIKMTAWYLNDCISKENGDIELGLARYNGGPLEAWRYKCNRNWKNAKEGTVISVKEMLGAVRLRKETKEYAPKILKYESKISRIVEVASIDNNQ